ncbi:hypothetical protein BJ912DRAFT_228697 [Pholiota molesta]|nr:hypothetical protein BJ912DRAFT_228697 [Pholiota molesta]
MDNVEDAVARRDVELFHFSSHIQSYPILPSLLYHVSLSLYQLYDHPAHDKDKVNLLWFATSGVLLLGYHPTIFFSFFCLFRFPICMVVSWFVFCCTNFKIDPFSTEFMATDGI